MSTEHGRADWPAIPPVSVDEPNQLTKLVSDALKREGVIVLEGKRRVVIPAFRDLVAESGDDSDGGIPS